MISAALAFGMTSFGATVLNGKIYVTGGKAGRAHHYARSYQNGEIWCLDLQGNQWETVGETLGLQGLAIVAHDGKIIRIGGLEARNEEGEEHALQSLADVKAFDPDTKKWSTLPSLPHGRSSFDACVHDNKVFVSGGWTMAIGEEPEWAEGMLVLDLSSEKPQWQSIETPFMTRAVAVRAFDNKIFVLGGIEDGGGPTEAVHVYDFENKEWTAGPNIPCEGGMKAFGCSAATVSGHLLVSTYDGGIYRLSDDHAAWEKVHQLDSGRFFHQMLPAGESSFAIVGGAHMKNGSQTEIVVFEVNTTNATEDATASLTTRK
jgi:N-acetylneuraminic acid mutarotase